MTDETRLTGALVLAFRAHRKDHWRFHPCSERCMGDIAHRLARSLEKPSAQTWQSLQAAQTRVAP